MEGSPGLDPFPLETNIVKTSLARCFPERIFIGSDHTGTIRLITRSLSAYSGLTVH